MPTNDAVSIAKDAVLSWRYLARSEQQEILDRLVSRTEAHKAWRALSEKDLVKGTFWEVANTIGRRALDVPLSLAETRTRLEIREAAERAASLAKELVTLIERNATLKQIHYELMPPAEHAAMERILGGVISLSGREEQGRRPGDFFPAEIEQQLDVIQTSELPEFHSMTTSEAYKVLRNAMYEDASFVFRLSRFAELAEESSNIPPIVPNPKRASTKQHVFALHVCTTLVHFYGSPNCELVADLASAAFNANVNNELVKKWWQRKGPLWQGDNLAPEK